MRTPTVKRPLFLVCVVALAASPTQASWVGDSILGYVLDVDGEPAPTYDWVPSSALVTLAGAEFTRALTQVTTTADFTSNKLIITYENTGGLPNITYPPLTYKFEDLDVGGAGITALSPISSSFSQPLTTSFTANSITVNVPRQNTNGGETFTAVFELSAATSAIPTDYSVETSAPLVSYEYIGTHGSAVAGYEINNPQGKALLVESAYDPAQGLGADEAVKEDFVIYDGTLLLEVATSDPQGPRADLRTTYRMRVDARRRLEPRYLRARFLRQGVTSDPRYARTAARAGRIADLRIMRFVENERRWIRAVRASGARADIRFLPRQEPDGVVGHYGTSTDNTYVWAVMDRNSKYAVGINVDNDSDGYFNADDNCRDTSNPDQINSDDDVLGNACDPDDDNDDVLDEVDNCPLQANADQADEDNDGVGNLCDFDADNDGVDDGLDQCPNTLGGEVVDAAGCSIADLCPCDSPWKNHGAFMKCTAQRAASFVDDGLISEEEKDAVVSAAGASACGKR